MSRQRKMADRKDQRKRKTPVEKAWLKFVDEFLVFREMVHDESDKENNKAWQKALLVTDRAANAVAEERATCLRDMQLKIQAWAFQSGVKIGNGKNLNELDNWQPDERFATNSEFIASLRDDILAMKKMAWGASIAVGSIVSGRPPMPDMPTAEPYPPH